MEPTPTLFLTHFYNDTFILKSQGTEHLEHPETKRRAVMTRIEPDAKLPLHRHMGDELIFVIEGANAGESGPVTTAT